MSLYLASQEFMFSMKFRDLFEYLPVAYQSLDIYGRWIDANQEMANLLGFDTPEAMLGKNFADYWDDAVRDQFPAVYGQFKVDHGTRNELQLRRCDGSPVTVILTGRVQRDKNGRFVRTHCTLTDISERRSMENKILKLNADLEARVEARTAELNDAIAHLQRLASEDSLTGLWRRWRFEESVDLELDRVQRYGGVLSLAILDVDHFKNINDQYGHSAGDQVLVRLAALLKQHLRSVDVLARWGGEEFAVMLPKTNVRDAMTVVEKLREMVFRECFPIVGTVTVSGGIAEWQPGQTFDDCFTRADDALYVAKAEGRNRICQMSSQAGHKPT